MKYKDLYPLSSSGVGLIYQLCNDSGLVFHTSLSTLQRQGLERAYYLRSGFKTISDSFVEIPEQHHVLVITSMFQAKWNKLWNLYQLEYNPLSAYKVVESGDNSIERTSQDLNTYGRTQSVNTDDTGSVTTQGSSESSTTVGLYGFNSQTSVPSDTSANHSSTSDTENRDLNTTSLRTDGGSDTVDRESTEQSIHNVTKEGNIGYSTPQKLLREEFELWAVPFFEKVFADIDNFITIQVF